MALVQGQKAPVVGSALRMVAKSRGVQIPPHTFEHRPHLPHVGTIVVHEKTKLGRNVTLFHGVTIGRGNIWEEPHADFGGFVVEDDVILCANAVVINSHGILTIGQGTVIAANAVLRQSTGPNEVWAGNPATRIK